MRRRFFGLALALLPVSACDHAIPNYASPSALLPTVALADRAAFVDKTSLKAYLLDPADKSLRPRIVPVGKAPIAAVKRNGKNQLLVLSAGDRGSTKGAPVAAQLQTIDANPAVDSVVYPLVSSFDTLAQSDDGSIVLLYHGPLAQNSSSGALFDPNQLAIVTLDVPGTPSRPNPYSKSIRSFGGVPTGVVFSPAYTFAGTQRILAVVLAPGYVTILDVNNPDRTEITVPLSPDNTHTFTPSQVLFDTDPSHPNIYVRADGSNDIFQLALADLGSATLPGNDFRVSLSMLAAGTGPSDMALFHGTGDAIRLAVLAPGSRTLVVIDPSTSSTTSVPMSIPADRMVLFNAGTPSAPTKLEDRALLVDVSSGSTSVLFAEMKSIETGGTLSLVDHPLTASASAVVPLVDQGIAVLQMSARSSGTTALTVVDLASRNFNIVAGNPSSTAVIDPGNASRPSTQWSMDGNDPRGLYHVSLTAYAGQPPLVIGETWLDQTITGILPLGQASSDTHRYVFVEQSDPDGIGNVTVLDADAPEHNSARTAYGFLLTDFLKRGQP
jgi:hypothetical protein